MTDAWCEEGEDGHESRAAITPMILDCRIPGLELRMRMRVDLDLRKQAESLTARCFDSMASHFQQKLSEIGVATSVLGTSQEQKLSEQALQEMAAWRLRLKKADEIRDRATRRVSEMRSTCLREVTQLREQVHQLQAKKMDFKHSVTLCGSQSFAASNDSDSSDSEFQDDRDHQRLQKKHAKLTEKIVQLEDALQKLRQKSSLTAKRLRTIADEKEVVIEDLNFQLDRYKIYRDQKRIAEVASQTEELELSFGDEDNDLFSTCAGSTTCDFNSSGEANGLRSMACGSETSQHRLPKSPEMVSQGVQSEACGSDPSEQSTQTELCQPWLLEGSAQESPDGQAQSVPAALQGLLTGKELQSSKRQLEYDAPEQATGGESFKASDAHETADEDEESDDEDYLPQLQSTDGRWCAQELVASGTSGSTGSSLAMRRSQALPPVTTRVLELLQKHRIPHQDGRQSWASQSTASTSREMSPAGNTWEQTFPKPPSAAAPSKQGSPLLRRRLVASEGPSSPGRGPGSRSRSPVESDGPPSQRSSFARRSTVTAGPGLAASSLPRAQGAGTEHTRSDSKSSMGRRRRQTVDLVSLSGIVQGQIEDVQ
eukprot:TRINITY_DN9954_c0_g1_i2.p1 TRINITY_DN9954_c0_g1~~TRINITY_DN9954_c0_g1_i2.p1  ORF type:complete len:598 (+),score=144.17 TRINITY_DN9954_c0_g1_i2:43-1836(+)